MSEVETGGGPEIAAAASRQADTDRAVQEVCQQAAEAFGGPADLAVLFTSHHHGPEYSSMLERIRTATGAKCLVGTTGESIVAAATEIERAPAVSLWLARLPGVKLTAMHLETEETPEGRAITGWPDELPEPWPEGAALLVLGEPFTFDADLLLARLNELHPGTPAVGGMSSGAMRPGDNRVFLDGEENAEGAVAVLIEGAVRVRTVVSQGCRPIGTHYVVTKAENNVLEELGGRPPLARLDEVVRELEPRDRELLRQGLHVGRVTNEYQERFGRGDFLIRNVIGADRESGAMAVADYIRRGQTVQFHVRDAETADEDLRELLDEAAGEEGFDPRGALLFTCNGRGSRLFGAADHDAGVVSEKLGGVPVAGFFAQGEIGPVGGGNFLHGFTASVAIFEGVG